MACSFRHVGCSHFATCTLVIGKGHLHAIYVYVGLPAHAPAGVMVPPEA